MKTMSRKKKRAKKRKAGKGCTPSPVSAKRLITEELNIHEDYSMMESQKTDTGALPICEEDLCLDDLKSEDTVKILKNICQKLNFVVNKVNEIDRKQDQILERVQKVEQSVGKHEEEIARIKEDHDQLSRAVTEVQNKLQKDFDPDYTIVVTNPPVINGPLTNWATGLITALGGNRDMIVNAMRTPQRQGRKGVLKIEVRTVDEKINLLRKKSSLQNFSQYKNIFVRSSKSHSERLQEINFRTVLSQLPDGSQYRIAGNGRIVKRDDQKELSPQRTASVHVPGSSNVPFIGDQNVRVKSQVFNQNNQPRKQEVISTSTPVQIQKTSSPHVSQLKEMQQTHEMQTGHPQMGQSGMSGSIQHVHPGPSSINPLHHQQPVFSTPVGSNQVFVQSQDNQFVQASYIPGSTVDRTFMNTQFTGHDGSYIGHNLVGTK